MRSGRLKTVSGTFGRNMYTLAAAKSRVSKFAGVNCQNFDDKIILEFPVNEEECNIIDKSKPKYTPLGNCKEESTPPISNQKDENCHQAGSFKVVLMFPKTGFD